MAERTFDDCLWAIRTLQIELEQTLQALAALRSNGHCARCAAVCCRERFCRESVDSDFLRFILGAEREKYDHRSGWLDPARGCRLPYGRPLVCYEYSCATLKADDDFGLATMSRRMKSLYGRALRGQHILTVDDITRIPLRRLAAIRDNLSDLLRTAVETLHKAGAGPSFRTAPIRFRTPAR